MSPWTIRYTRKDGDFESQPPNEQEKEALRRFPDLVSELQGYGIYVGISYRGRP